MNRPAAIPARLLHLLEPEWHPPVARIDKVLRGAVATRLIPQHSTPERHDLGAGGRARDDKKAMDRRRVGREDELASSCRVLAGHVDMALDQPALVLE